MSSVTNSWGGWSKYRNHGKWPPSEGMRPRPRCSMVTPEWFSKGCAAREAVFCHFSLNLNV